MYWLNNIPDISLKKLATIIPRFNFKNFNKGLVNFSLDQDMINSFFIDFAGSNEYIKEIRIVLAKDHIKTEINFNIKGVYYNTRYLITIESFAFYPGKHQVILKYDWNGRRSPFIEKIHDLTIRPYITKKLERHGAKVNEPYIEFDLNNIKQFRTFKSSLVGTLLLTNLRMRIRELANGVISFEIDVSSLKENLEVIKATLINKVKEPVGAK